MALTDARVKFLRGLQANLPSTKTDGNVYIATDERAMYVDYLPAATVANPNPTVQRIRIGDIIEYSTFETIRALPTTALSTSALYYATTDNILAKWTGTTWIQINAQKTLDDYIYEIIHSVSLSSDTATVGLAFKNDDGVTLKTTDFKLETADNAALKIAIDASNRKVILRGSNVTGAVGVAVAANGTISFSNVYTGTDSSGNAVNTTTNGPSIQITHVNASGVKVTGNATTGVISIDSDYRIVGAANNNGTVDGSTVARSLDIGLTNINSGGIVVEESVMRLTPRIVVGDSSQTTTTRDAVVTYTANTKEAVMTISLPVYTITQVDNLISTSLKNINSMTFKGNIKASGGTVTAPPLAENSVKIGDTYIVADGGNYATNVNNVSVAAITGDLFIATSTAAGTAADPLENTLGYIDRDNIQWIHVPSGDDAAHTYALQKATASSANGSIPYIYLKNDADVWEGNGIGIGAGLESADVTENGNTITVIKHKTFSAATATAQTAVSISDNQTANTNTTASGSITAITGLTLENGHITGYTTKQFSVALTQAIVASRLTNAVANNVATLTAAVQNAAEVWLDATGMTLTSNSLTFTSGSSGASLNVDMLWETF